MSARNTFNVALTPGLHAFTAGRLGSGRFGNVSETVRAAALHLLEERGLRFGGRRRATTGTAELDAR